MDNFIVSARKYRPATFESVVGQGHITATLKNAIGRGQLAHAYLFCGPRGVGKTTCARIFAKAINCLSPVDSEACGECESCRGFNEGRSFNIHELDAASNNSVDDIRSLTEQVRIPPQIGRYSVYIIDEVHMLSASAFNAFLKTLEEPPAHAVFILATTEKHKIIPTILSRCQIYDFNRIRVEDGVNYLKYIASKEAVTADDESLHLIAQKADGGMRDALSMFDKAVSFCGSDLKFKEVARTLNVLDYDTYFNITSLIVAGDYPAVLTAFDLVLRNGFTPQTFTGGLNAHFRDLLMSKSPQTANLLEVTGGLLERYKKQGAECDVGFLFEAIAVLTAVDGTLRTATNQRLNVELGLMKLCGLGQKKNEHTVNGALADVSGDSPAAALAHGGDGNVPLPELKKGAHGMTPAVPKSVAGSAQKNNRAEQDATARSKEVAGISGGVTTEPAGATSKAEEITAPKTKIPTATDLQVSQVDATTAYTQASAASAGETTTPQADATPTVARQVADVGVTKTSIPGTGLPPARREPLKSINGTARSISGVSIDTILNTPKNIHEVSESDGEAAREQVVIDPESASKIAGIKEMFVDKLDRKWPRIAVVMSEMKVVDNKIHVVVPTRTLHDEVMRNRTELLTMIVSMAEIEGFVDIVVEIRENYKPRKPIKAEDRLKHMSEKNPAIALLRKKLDMDID